MGKKAERMAYAAIETTLENIGIVKFVELFKEAAYDVGALEDGLDFTSEKREKQFRDGFAKLLKARKGAERDAKDDEEDCDCPSSFAIGVQPEKRVNETVANFLLRMHHWTGLHISINMALAEIMRVDFNVKKLAKKMRKCQSIDELATLLTEKAGGRILIRESARGKLLPGAIRLTASSAAYVVCLA